MKICFVVASSFPAKEGIGFYSWNLASELTRKGHQVTIITRGGFRNTQKEVVDGITIYRPPFVPLYPVHVHLHKIFVNQLIKDMEDEIDLIHYHSPLVCRVATKLPAVITFHTTMKANTGSQGGRTFMEFLNILQTKFSIALEKDLLKGVNLVTSVASSVAEELDAYQIDPQTVIVMGNGVNTRLFKPGQTESHEKAPQYFLTAGRLAPRKGLEDLISCAKIVSDLGRDVEFWIAGSGPYLGRLRKMTKSLGIDSSVRFLGHVSNRNEMVRLYQETIGYIHAAHYEGLPTVLLEAMACATPVVSTAVSGALDVLKNEVNGLLVPPHAPEQMAQNVIRLLDSPELRSKLGQAAFSTTQELFSWETIGANYLKVYEKLISRHLTIGDDDTRFNSYQ